MSRWYDGSGFKLCNEKSRNKYRTNLSIRGRGRVYLKTWLVLDSIVDIWDLKKARNCRFIRNDPNLVTISSYVQIRANDEANLQSVLVSRGPVSAAMDASRRGLQFYDNGNTIE